MVRFDASFKPWVTEVLYSDNKFITWFLIIKLLCSVVSNYTIVPCGNYGLETLNSVNY